MNCSEVRGFNYSGSWGTSGLDLWQHHDHGTMAVEIARGKRYFPKWNVCRWWLSQDAYMRNPERFLANFEAGLSLFAHHGILVMPVLYNRWHSSVCDFGGVYLEHIIPGMADSGADLFAYSDAVWPRKPRRYEAAPKAYLEAVVGEHRNDARIFAWDLCNEALDSPYVNDPSSALLKGELNWLTWCYAMCKRVGATQPLTLGNCPGIIWMQLTDTLCDLISFHPYYMYPAADKVTYERILDEAVEFALRSGKELLASETVWGAIDDDKHLWIMHYTLGELRKRNIGFLVHALQHSLVADLHYPQYGPVSGPETLHFVNPDGSLRKGHEAFNEYC